MDPGDGELGLRRRRGARLSLEATHLAELIGELSPYLAKASVRDVAGLPPRDLLLVLDAPGAPPKSAPRRLRLSVTPDAARMHVQHGRVKRHDGPPGPFYQQVASDLDGATLVRIEQVRGDRIALLEFRDSPTGERRALLAELFGRNGNLVLLGPGDRILAVLVTPRGKSAERLAQGSVWSAPQSRAQHGEDTAGLATKLAEAGEPPEDSATPLSWRVERYFEPRAEAQHEESARKRLQSRVARKLSRARSALRGLERRTEAADGSERVRQDGELLKAELGRFERGATRVRVQDWFADGSPERELEVDPKLSPQENVERYFKRYRKLERARANLGQEIERATERVTSLEALEAEAADESTDPVEVDARAVQRGLLDPLQQADPRKRKAPAARLPYKTFRGGKGGEIRVGRSARDNDTLTLRHARGNDLWLHTADSPGSHVVLRVERSAEPDADEILDAAHLAIHFSPLRGTDKADVHVVRSKHVHKPARRQAGPRFAVRRAESWPFECNPSAWRGYCEQTARRPPTPVDPPRERPRGIARSLLTPTDLPAMLRSTLPLALSATLVLGACSSKPKGPSREELIELHFETALRYYDMDELDRALDQASRGLKVDPKNERLRLLSGWVLQRRGTRESIATAERVFRGLLTTNDYRVRLGLGQALERKGKFFDEAARAIENGDRFPDAGTPAERGAELREEARAAWVESIERYEQTLERQPGDRDALNGLQRVHALLGQDEQSLAYSTELVDVVREHQRFWRDQLTDDITAGREADIHYRLDDDEELLVKTHLHAASVLRRLGRIDAAIDEIQRVVDLRPDMPQVHSRHAQMLYDAGDYERASRAIERYLKLSEEPVDHPDIQRAWELKNACDAAIARG